MCRQRVHFQAHAVWCGSTPKTATASHSAPPCPRWPFVRASRCRAGGVCHLSSSIIHSSLIHSPFIIHHPPYVHHASLITHPSSFIIHHSSFIASSLIIHHSSSDPCLAMRGSAARAAWHVAVYNRPLPRWIAAYSAQMKKTPTHPASNEPICSDERMGPTVRPKPTRWSDEPMVEPSFFEADRLVRRARGVQHILQLTAWSDEPMGPSIF